MQEISSLISPLISHWADLFFLSVFLFIVSPFLGRFLYRLFAGEKTFLHPLLFWAECGALRLLGISPQQQMSAWEYGCHLGALHLVSFVTLALGLWFQGWLFSSSTLFSPLSLPLIINIVVSFITNSNWQAYTPETSVTNGVQMLGLMVQQFLSPSIGMATTLVFMRGIVSKGSGLLGNLWVDLVRCILYLLLPLSILLAAFLLHQGSIATFQNSTEYTTLEGKTERIGLGSVAAQTAIMQLGTNGGGFFQANSAHPFANPSDSSNVVLIVAILLIPAALPHLYGEMIGSRRDGWLLFILTVALWLCGSALAEIAQARSNPFYPGLEVVEGQEVRNGVFASVLWGTSTTATTNGSVNSALDSFAPMTGGVLLAHLLLGESLFGGVGIGLASMLFFVLLTLFLSGLMVGRSPEYQGKKIGRRHMQWVMGALLVPSALILMASSLCILFPESFHEEPAARSPHAFTALLYAVGSCVMNNGSAFSSFAGNTGLCDLFFALLMMLGRLAILLPSLALGSLFARQPKLPISEGSFSTSTPLFFFLLGSVLLLYTLLLFFPSWILGPFSEQVLLDHGQLW